MIPAVLATNDVEVLYKSVPDIIKEASASPLGILALIILALAIMGVLFFRGAKIQVKMPIYLALVVGAAVYAISIHNTPTVGKTFQGHVKERPDDEPVAHALINADVDGGTETRLTDSSGDYVLTFNSPKAQVEEIAVEKDGYEPFTKNLPGPPGAIPNVIYLKKIQEAGRVSTGVRQQPEAPPQRAAAPLTPAAPPITQEARINVDWSIANYTPADQTNCPDQYLITEPKCLTEGGRACLMRRAIESAKADNCSYALRLTLITQCHNQGARESITNSGEQALCAYLKTK